MELARPRADFHTRGPRAGRPSKILSTVRSKPIRRRARRDRADIDQIVRCANDLFLVLDDQQGVAFSRRLCITRTS